MTNPPNPKPVPPRPRYDKPSKLEAFIMQASVFIAFGFMIFIIIYSFLTATFHK